MCSFIAMAISCFDLSLALLHEIESSVTCPLRHLQRIIMKAYRLVDLGTGSFIHDPKSETYQKLKNAMSKCESIRSLFGFLDVVPHCLTIVYPKCPHLTSLNLSYAPGIDSNELINLQRRWILDCIGHKGLGLVAAMCKELEDLRVFPSDPFGAGNDTVTEGLWLINPSNGNMPDDLILLC